MTAAVLDHFDTFYLANYLSAGALRHEIHRAELKASLAEAYLDTESQTNDDTFPWVDYANTCREALKLQRQNTPKQTPATGHIDIEAIKAKNDIVTVIERYTKLRKSGKNLTGKCPIHQDKNPSLTVYPDKQSWHCYGCNRGGDVIAFIEAVENTDFKGATAILGGNNGNRAIKATNQRVESLAGQQGG